VSRALWDSGIAQWAEHYGMVNGSVGRVLSTSEIARWLERCGIVGWLSG